ncbi:13101_t:CDS:2 [Funneliformis caledonium]|uniref:13101_t:CDS:1 n=1 Tax=Funneliformis caledonium TaxID=1117310 RepID=A0A9N9EXU1_9GLOM|nr:13101_t:CDS:2 [Funneliformis caledonium]
MSTELSDLLHNEYDEVLNSCEFSDIEIMIGEDPDTKVYKAHSLILKIRSPYFRTALTDDSERTDDNNVIKLQKSDITVEVFDILIKYMYSSFIDLYRNDIKTNVALLIAADELCLNGLCNFIEEHLLSDEILLKQNFILIQSVASKYHQFNKLVQFCEVNFELDPSLIFMAEDFTEIKQEILLDVIEKNNHAESPIEIWDRLFEWCVAQSNDELSLDVTKWTQNETSIFRSIVQPFLPHQC